MKRRDLLMGTATAGAFALTGAPVHAQKSTDGTPLQFAPKSPPDPNPLENELKKYPRCPYCGMDRAEYSQSRHLIHYDDNLVDATCSIHCAAISLGLNMDRGPKAIYAGDYGSREKIKPLVNVDQATYVIGSDARGTMTMRSKVAFASGEQARQFQREHGGETGNFDQALTATYADMAKDNLAIRKRRAERRTKPQQ